MLPGPPALTHSVSAVSASPIDLYSSNKYFYIVLAASTAASSSSSRLLLLCPRARAHRPAASHVLPGQPRHARSGRRGQRDHQHRGRRGQRRHQHAWPAWPGWTTSSRSARCGSASCSRSGRVNEKWTIGEDGLIYSAWKRDYVLGGKPCKFFEILTECKEDGGDAGLPRTGSTSSSHASQASARVGRLRRLFLCTASRGPWRRTQRRCEGETGSRSHRARPAAEQRRAEGHHGPDLPPALPHAVVLQPALAVRQQPARPPRPLLQSLHGSNTAASMGFSVPKQLGVLRQCCGVEECEKEKIGDGVECGFIAVNGEEERDRDDGRVRHAGQGALHAAPAAAGGAEGDSWRHGGGRRLRQRRGRLTATRTRKRRRRRRRASSTCRTCPARRSATRRRRRSQQKAALLKEKDEAARQRRSRRCSASASCTTTLSAAPLQSTVQSASHPPPHPPLLSAGSTSALSTQRRRLVVVAVVRAARHVPGAAQVARWRASSWPSCTTRCTRCCWTS